MIKKRLVSVVGCFIVASLILTGCDKGSDVTTSVVKQKPEYGGVLNLAVVADTTGFDDAIQPHYTCGTLKLTNEELWEGDWTIGRAGGYGSGESDWFLGGSLNRLKHKGGSLAESWEITDKDTITFHIREGVYWYDKPPVNGRELTADDIVFSSFPIHLDFNELNFRETDWQYAPKTRYATYHLHGMNPTSCWSSS